MLPKTITVKGKRYKVKESLKDENLLGLCHRDKKLIEIDPNIKSNKEKLTIFAHELCHAYMFEYNLSQILSHSTEELICMAVEDIVSDLIDITLKNAKELK